MGGGSNKAQKEAAAAEEARKAQILGSDNAINALFNSPAREAQIQDFLGASREFYTNDLNRQKDINDRQMKFAQARNGMTGGSVAIDAGRTAGENYERGVVESERLAQHDAAGLRGQDESAKLNLLSLAQTGADTTTLASQGASLLRNNLLAGNAGRQASALGNVFGDFSDIYKRSQDNAQLRQGYKYGYGANGYYGPVGGTPAPGYGGKG